VHEHPIRAGMRPKNESSYDKGVMPTVPCPTRTTGEHGRIFRVMPGARPLSHQARR
jgi:hypothetical protein